MPSSGRMVHCHEEAGAMRLSVEMATATVADSAFAWPTPRRFLDAKTGKTITHGVSMPFDWSSLRFALWGLVPALLLLGWFWRRRRLRPRSK